MKLERMELRDFRGFPGPDVYSFDLSGGKNLLIFGENGSGKSSLYRALVEFFNFARTAKEFGWHRNIFSTGPDQSSLEGYVSLRMDDGTCHEWNCGGRRPLADVSVPQAMREQLVDAARRTGLLEYRSLLRTSFGTADVQRRLFDLAVTTLIANVPVSIPGGGQHTVSQLWTNLLFSKPTRRTQRQLGDVKRAETAFNSGIQGILPDVEAGCRHLLAYFLGSGLDVGISFQGVYYNAGYQQIRDCDFERRELDLEVRLNGTILPEWSEFLNEARLSALALSLYLAGVKLCNPTVPSGAAEPLQLIVLDDVLIGLDLTHRLPILRILEAEFSDYQVLLLTHDRVWFEMAQLAVHDHDRWVSCEMFSKPDGQPGAVYDRPIVKWLNSDLAEHHLALAREYLDVHNDPRTAAFHARVAFEMKLKSRCRKARIPVPYDPDGRDLGTDDFLKSIEKAMFAKGTVSLAAWTLQRVKLFRRGVLNPLAHCHPITLATGEVKEAIESVDKLKFKDDEIKKGQKTDFAAETDTRLTFANPSDSQRLDAACWLRTTFEVDLRALLCRLKAQVPYKPDAEILTLAELWISAKAAMQVKNNIAALGFIQDIEAHGSVYLNEWTYATVSVLTKTQLDAAWIALRDGGGGAPRTKFATFN